MKMEWKKFWIELSISKTWGYGRGIGQFAFAFIGVNTLLLTGIGYKYFSNGDMWNERDWTALEVLWAIGFGIFIPFLIFSIFKEKRGEFFWLLRQTFDRGEKDGMWVHDRFQTKRVTVRFNGDFYAIVAQSSYGLFISDPRATERYLPPDVRNAELGRTVRDSLLEFKPMSADEAKRVFAASQGRYNDWVIDLMKRFGYRSHAELFENMNVCGVEMYDNRITIYPTRHKTSEQWQIIRGDKTDFLLNKDASDADLGAMLRLALQRCPS